VLAGQSISDYQAFYPFLFTICTSASVHVSVYISGWVCHICLNCNYGNFKNRLKMQQITHYNDQNKGTSSCAKLMLGDLDGVTEIPTQVKVIDGKIAEKEKGWACLDCRTSWLYKKIREGGWYTPLQEMWG
jgi:hypothetical protein